MGDTIFKVVVATVLYLKAFDETKMTVKKGSIVSNNNWANKMKKFYLKIRISCLI